MKNEKLIKLLENLIVNGCPFKEKCRREAELESRNINKKKFEDSFFPRGIYFNKHNLFRIEVMIIADNPGPRLKGEPRSYKSLDELMDAWKNIITIKKGTPFMRILGDRIIPFMITNFYRKNLKLEETLDLIYFTQQTKCGGFEGTDVPWSIRGRCFTNYLKKEIELLRPKLILALGRKVYDVLKFHFHDNDNIKICWIHHPSYLARQKSKIEEDLKRLEECLLNSN